MCLIADIDDAVPSGGANNGLRRVHSNRNIAMLLQLSGCPHRGIFKDHLSQLD